MLERNWNGQMANGVRLYDLHAYQATFLLIAAWAVVSCVLIALTRETFCRPHAYQAE